MAFKSLKHTSSFKVSIAAVLFALLPMTTTLIAQEVNRPKVKAPGTYYDAKTKAGVKLDIAYPADWDGCPALMQRKVWWRNWQWKDKADKPYAKAKRDIDIAVKRGVKPIALVKKYKTAVSSDLYDPLKTYRWSYAAWLARKEVDLKRESDAIFYPLYDHFSEAPFPDSYHYARMGFLVNAYKRPSQCLKPLGNRLLKRNPKDDDVKFYMVRILPVTRTAKDDKRALAYLNYFRNKYPKNTYYVREKALTQQYFFRRQYPLEQKKADIAINSFEFYLKVAPTDYEKKWAKAMMADVEREMENWNLYGRKYWLKSQAGKRK